MGIRDLLIAEQRFGGRWTSRIQGATHPARPEITRPTRVAGARLHSAILSEKRETVPVGHGVG